MFIVHADLTVRDLVDSRIVLIILRIGIVG